MMETVEGETADEGGLAPSSVISLNTLSIYRSLLQELLTYYILCVS